MPRLSRVHRQLLAMTVWAVALIAVDHFFNKHIYGSSPAPPPHAGQPQITVRLNHLCCSGCYDSAFQAMKRFSWLGHPKVLRQVLPTPQQANQTQAGMGHDAAPGADSGEIAVDVNPAQMYQVDFVELDRAIREGGLVPAQLKVSGISHFELVAYLPHFCCHVCEAAVKETFAAGKNIGQAPPLRGTGPAAAPVVDFVQQQVRSQFWDEADVTQFLRALERTGFAPRWVHINILA